MKANEFVKKYGWDDRSWNIKNMIRHATDVEIETGCRL